MNSFILITKKLLDIENKYSCDSLIKFRFCLLITKEITTQNKYIFFNETMNNIFLGDKAKEQFAEYFCKITKIYNGFSKLARIYRDKYSKIVVNVDMGLNEICENQNGVMSILQDKSKYLFKINDLINMIETSLTNHYNFFALPLCIKNPYNNLPFSKSSLYNMYFFIKFKTHSIPTLFFHFFNCDFNLSCFAEKHDYLLREYAIDNYVYKSPGNIVEKEILNMLKTFNSYCKSNWIKKEIHINKDFPRETLIKVMRPYLLYFMMSRYSLLLHKKHDANYMYKKLLVRFCEYNPQFGRKKYKILMGYNKNHRKCIVGKIIEFNDKHITFNNKKFQNNSFLTDHLVCRQTIYYNYNETNDINIPDPHFLFNDEEEEHEEDEEEIQVEYNIEDDDEAQEDGQGEESQNDEDSIS